jgi:hypothetical protein
MARGGSGMPPFQQGGKVHGPTLALVGEAGPEAVIPLQHGQIPTMMDRMGRLFATMPSGMKVPLAMDFKAPAMAAGGVVLPTTQGNLALAASGPSRGSASGAAGGTNVINFTVNAVDAGSFRASQGQILADLSMALDRAKKRQR